MKFKNRKRMGTKSKIEEVEYRPYLPENEVIIIWRPSFLTREKDGTITSHETNQLKTLQLDLVDTAFMAALIEEISKVLQKQLSEKK